MAISKKTSKVNPKTTLKKTKKNPNKCVSKKTKTDAQLIGWYTQKRIQAFISIVVITLFTIIIFGGLGWMIDYYAGTKPAFLIILLIVSFPITQILLYKRLKKISKS